MRTWLVGGVLFFSSFAPLLAVFGLLNSFGKGPATYVCYGIAALSVIVLWVSFLSWRSLATTQATIHRARSRDADVIAYVATYIIPFAALQVETWHQRGALIAFFVLVGILYVRANLFYVNPMLALFGFRLFEVETTGGRSVLVISRSFRMQIGSVIQVRALSDDVYLQT